MDLTFDSQGVGDWFAGLAGDGVVRLTGVRSAVTVNSLVDDVLRRFDSSHCAVKLPGEVGGWDGHRRAGEGHFGVQLYLRFTRHRCWFRTIWAQNGNEKSGSVSGFNHKGFDSSESVYLSGLD